MIAQLLMMAALAASASQEPASSLESRHCDAVAEAAYDDHEASEELKTCAKHDDPHALFVLGIYFWEAGESDDLNHDFGVGVVGPEARDEGWRLMRAAAEAGYPPAQNEIGRAYYKGHYGAEIDFEIARDWFVQAYEAGDEIAGINLAEIYALGHGVEVDIERAEGFLKTAAKRGDEHSRCALNAWRIIKQQLDDEVRHTAFQSLIERPPYCQPPPTIGSVISNAVNRIDFAARSTSSRIPWTAIAYARFLEAHPVDPSMCPVYRSWANGALAEGSNFLISTTQNWPPFDLANVDRDTWTFRRDTGETESLSFTGSDQTYEVPITESFEFDAQAITKNITADLPLNLAHCFDGDPRERFVVHGLPGLPSPVPRRPQQAMVTRITEWFVTPVGFSDDGDHALIYTEHFCGPLCAGGIYYLFERSDAGDWSVIGTKGTWVS